MEIQVLGNYTQALGKGRKVHEGNDNIKSVRLWYHFICKKGQPLLF